VAEGMAKQRAIQVGAVSLTEVEIREGLAEGDAIIISDTSRFQEAQTVLLR
jgi:hypothetical protein